jgi:large subunit ribosomal protein L29
MKIAELRQKNREDLQQELIESSEELFKLKMQKGVAQQQVRPHTFKEVRRRIARIKTLLNEKASQA